MLGIYEVMREVANQGMDDVGQVLGQTYEMDILLETMSLRVMPDLCILDKLLDLGVTAMVGYSLFYLMSISPTCVLMSLSVCLSLFFSLLVGS